MDPMEIPRHKVEMFHSPESQIIRAHTPQLLNTLVDQGVLGNIESVADIKPGSVTALEGGLSSACYFLENNGKPVAIKFRTWGVDSEAETLRIWREVGVNVTQINSSGDVPLNIGTKNPVRYLILEGIVDESGNPAPTGGKFLSNHPDLLQVIGAEMGHQLFLLHQAKAEHPFGSFGDGSARPQFETWSQHLSEIVETNKKYLLDIGVGQRSIDDVLQKYQQIHFPIQGSYLHNDFNLDNILVENINPLKIRVFDPDSLIGDPYWDLARVISRQDFHQLQAEKQGDTAQPWLEKEKTVNASLSDSYFKEAGQELDEQRLQANLIGVTIIKNLYAGKRNKTEEIDIRREQLKGYINQFAF